MEMSELKDIAIALMEALRANKLGEVEIKLGDARICVKDARPAPAVAAASAPAAPVAAVAPAATEQNAPAAEALPAGTQVVSPLVGVYYGAPAPDAPPYVFVGQKVKKDDTLFIVEAMKTMNEIKSPCDGTVVRILAQPGDMVEYNQVVVVIE